MNETSSKFHTIALCKFICLRVEVPFFSHGLVVGPTTGGLFWADIPQGGADREKDTIADPIIIMS